MTMSQLNCRALPEFMFSQWLIILDVELPGPGLALPGGGGGGGQHEHGGLSEGDGEETVLCSFSIFFLFQIFLHEASAALLACSMSKSLGLDLPCLVVEGVEDDLAVSLKVMVKRLRFTHL